MSNSNYTLCFCADAGAGALLVTAVDEVAWLLNLRGGDVSHNPVFTSYVLVKEDSATLYVDQRKVCRPWPYYPFQRCVS